jgi:hypothetical protein
MFHVAEDEDTVSRCPACYDDIYEQPDRFDCTRCYGTSFDGGVKERWRAWAIFTDTLEVEDISARGVWHPIKRQLHTEHKPDLWKRDFVVRATDWDGTTIVAVEGIYVFDDVTMESLRTGNQSGQITRDVVGQRASLNRISEEMPIYQLPLAGRSFARFDGKPR